jgi:CheY-like chemotaxis protein
VTTALSVLPCERILLVEDDTEMLSILLDVLELGGAQVVGVASADQAWAALDGGFRPSIFVIDVYLGRGTAGDTLAREFRADPRFTGIPVVLLSGDSRKLRLSYDVADAELLKPFEMEELYSTLSDLCLRAQGSCPAVERAPRG